jgi:hypothetical protein
MPSVLYHDAAISTKYQVDEPEKAYLDSPDIRKKCMQGQRKICRYRCFTKQ